MEINTIITKNNEKNIELIKEIFPEVDITADYFKEYAISHLKSRLSLNKDLTVKYIELCKDKPEAMADVADIVKLDEDVMDKYAEYFDWRILSLHQKMSEDFMRKHASKLCWRHISFAQKLSEEFINEFKDNVDWEYISKYQKLSENFMRENKDYIIWDKILYHQKLSKKFLYEHIYKLYKADSAIKAKFILFLSVCINLFSSNMLYMPTFIKKRKVLKTGLYECFDDYFIAYKGIREDRYSCFNFQYKYLEGEIYECHPDYNDDDLASFGLNAGTKELAEFYCNELIIKCKIRYEDLAFISRYGDGKIRCCKLEVLD